MKHITTITMSTVSRSLWRGVGVLGIAVLAIVSLFAIEAAPLRGASYEASAWSTEGGFDYDAELDKALDNFNAGTGSEGVTGGGEQSANYNNHIGSTCTLTADIAVTNNGVDVNLDWNTTPEATYVTINEFPGEEFEASGSKDAFITETTKFIAYTHYANSNDTASCYVTVNYEKPPVVENPCKDASLTIDDADFTWDGPPALSHYTATYCDGSSSGKIDMSVGDTANVSLDKRIAKIEAKGGQCYLAKTQDCEVPVVDDPPVVVDPPIVDPPIDYCALVEVTINDDSFTWASPKAKLTGYNVEFCDGTIEKKSVYYTETATFDFDKRIKSVKTCGCDCTRVVTQTCDPEPKPPSCPLTPTADTKVVVFDDYEKLMSHGDSTLESTVWYPVSLPAGTYDIQTASWDGYLGRVNVSQPHEQWYLDLVYNNATVAKTAFTSDLQDYVTEAYKKDTVATDFSLGSAVDGVYARHAYWHDDSSWNSVVPICASFKRKTVEHEIKCTMSVSPTQVSKGGSATLTWTSENATDADIDQGIGDVNLDDSKSVTVNSNTTYTGTFTDDDGHSVTCTATVTVKSGGGGGGRCLNCDDDDDDDKDRKDRDRKPSVSLKKNELVAGAAISLSQVPYTGFSASPLVTAFFWLALLALSVVIAYFVTMARNRSMAFAGVTQAKTNDDIDLMEVATERPVYTTPAPVASYVASQATGSDANVIEDLAHKENILLSPEATREILIAAEAKGSLENTAVFLTQIFKEAQARYPREDGWILLSKERCASLLGAPQVTEASRQGVRAHEFKSQTQNGVAYGMPTSMPTSAPKIAVASAPTSASHQVASFVQLVSANEQQKAFELIRTITSQGVDLGVFIARVVRDLDEVYKNRIEGNRTPDQTLVELTSGWTTEMFEAVLGSLVECIDYSYSSTRIGTKIALAKVFEHFTK
jgi:uncharacterized protein YoaH (UPF0181 family)